MDPLAILLELERALADYPVQKIVRQTRCVTLYYADRMHLDVTPPLRAYGTLDRESFITHAKGPRIAADDRFVDMNAFGFARWYCDRTPLEVRMAKAVHEHWLGLERNAIRADAGLESVKRGDLFADRLMEWLRGRFGDRVVTKAADRMADEIGKGVQTAEQRYTRKGGLLLPTAGAVAAAASPAIVSAKPHSFYGIPI